jgi:hypothetical protein
MLGGLKTHHMFTVGLDVDSKESGVVVKLFQITGLFAGKSLTSASLSTDLFLRDSITREN